MDRTLRGQPVVVVQDSTHSLATTHTTGPSLCRRTVDQFVRKALVVSFTMVVGHELSQSSPKMPLPKRDDTMEAFLLHRPDKPFRIGVAVRRTRRRSEYTNARRREPLLHRPTPLRIPIADQDPPSLEESVRLATDGPQALDDEGFVRIRRRAQDLYTSGLQFDHECGVVGHESARRSHLGCEEVGRDESWPVHLYKRPPWRRALPSSQNAMRAQHTCDRRATHAVPNVLQRALNPCVAPRRILGRHSNDQGSEVCLQTTTARTRVSVSPFARDEFTVPAENRVWCDDRRHLREQTTPQSVPQFAEASSLAVVETQSPSTEPGLQNAILFSQKRDQICLLTMKPRIHRHDDQLKRSHARSLGDRVDPVVWHHARESVGHSTPPPKASDQRVGDYRRPSAEPYAMTPGAGRFVGTDILEADEAELRKAIQAVVDLEAPIHVSEMMTRVAGMWGTKAGSRIQSRIHDVASRPVAKGTVRRRGDFFWGNTDSCPVRSRTQTRIPTDRIAPEEFEQAILAVLAGRYNLPRPVLTTEVRSVLGYSRTGAIIEDAVSEAISRLLASGRLGETSTGLAARIEKM